MAVRTLRSGMGALRSAHFFGKRLMLRRLLGFALLQVRNPVKPDDAEAAYKRNQQSDSQAAGVSGNKTHQPRNDRSTEGCD